MEQPVEVIVNAWNRNLFPWWLLIPQGVSGTIKRRAGSDPFRELRRYGLLSLGDAVLTGAGRLPFRAIIHVAGIGLSWRASKRSIQLSVRNAMAIARRERFGSVAFPLIGAGTGGSPPHEVEGAMRDTLTSVAFDGTVIIVRFKKC